MLSSHCQCHETIQCIPCNLISLSRLYPSYLDKHTTDGAGNLTRTQDRTQGRSAHCWREWKDPTIATRATYRKNTIWSAKEPHLALSLCPGGTDSIQGTKVPIQSFCANWCYPSHVFLWFLMPQIWHKGADIGHWDPNFLQFNLHPMSWFWMPLKVLLVTEKQLTSSFWCLCRVVVTWIHWSCWKWLLRLFVEGFLSLKNTVCNLCTAFWLLLLCITGIFLTSMCPLLLKVLPGLCKPKHI